MRKISYMFLAATALLFGLSSCESEFDVDVEDKDPKMCVVCYAGASDTTWFTINKAVAVGAKAEQGDSFTINEMTLYRNGMLVGLHNGGDKTIWWTDASMAEGDVLDFNLKAQGMEEVNATTTIPEMPGFSTDTTVVGGLLQYTITFDGTVDETAHFAVGIMEHATYELEDTTIVYDGPADLTTVEAESSLMGQISNGLKMVDIDIDGMSLDCALFNGKDIIDHTYSIATYMEESATYSLVLLALSDEAYGYMNAQYNIQNNYLAMLGLSPPTFAYTNMDGGYGVLGGITRRVVR